MLIPLPDWRSPSGVMIKPIMKPLRRPRKTPDRGQQERHRRQQRQKSAEKSQPDKQETQKEIDDTWHHTGHCHRNTDTLPRDREQILNTLWVLCPCRVFRIVDRLGPQGGEGGLDDAIRVQAGQGDLGGGFVLIQETVRHEKRADFCFAQ